MNFYLCKTCLNKHATESLKSDRCPNCESGLLEPFVEKPSHNNFPQFRDVGFRVDRYDNMVFKPELAEKLNDNQNEEIEIGTKVLISRISSLEYREKNKKRLVKTDLDEPVQLIVSGLVRRHEGDYDKGYEGHDLTGGYSEPASFTATKHHWLYECKAGLKSKPILVSKEDLKKVSNAS